MNDFFEKVAALQREGQPFAVATVVARRAPVSGHLGDRAIVFADGRMEGFVGGACSREIVRKQALESLRTRHACLVSIRPDAGEASTSNPEHIIVPMTCVSEGAVDVYVEPFVPTRRLVVVGTTPVAEALTRTALSLDYEVVRVVDASEQRDLETSAGALGFTVAPLESLASVLGSGAPDVAAVVASQGHYDEQALEAILRSGAPYVGLVASRKRGATVRTFLEDSGVPGVDTVRYPAGIDLGARTAPEVALSILAEIVQARPSRTLTPPHEAAPPPAHEASAPVPGPDTTPPADEPVSAQPETRRAEPWTAVDPVCNMEVDVASARHMAVVDGTLYYFCCAQCRTRFTQDPSRYLDSRP
jgi:xanthine dehydrogenase accessory factor